MEAVMNVALILAAGVGQRMRNGGLPKQFLKLYGKPIVVYALEQFQNDEEIDKIIIACREGYTDMMNTLVQDYHISKTEKIIVGGEDRQLSIYRGLKEAYASGATDEDIVVIHDGVRPLVSQTVINENIRIAKMYGAAMTVHPVTESVIVCDKDAADLDKFKKRDDTYSLTAPQSFKLGCIASAYEKMNSEKREENSIPLLDAAMVYSKYYGEIHVVKEAGSNIKITTPEDYYYLKAMLEMEENKFIFGL